MTWQDIVISSVNFVFAIALIPSIVKSTKPHVLTCLTTAVGLTLLAVTFATLNLVLSTVGISFGALGWWILTAQCTIQHYKPSYLKGKE